MPNMLKNHNSGVWNSSDIGLDLGKLHKSDTDLGTLSFGFLPLEPLMTFSTPSLTLFPEKTFWLMSSVMLLLVL